MRINKIVLWKDEIFLRGDFGIRKLQVFAPRHFLLADIAVRKQIFLHDDIPYDTMFTSN